MDNNHQENIFFEQNNTEIPLNTFANQDLLNRCVPYLQKGDSSKYLDQFLSKEDLPNIQNYQQQKSNKADLHSSPHEEYSIQNNVKFNASSFHNFQKHLTVCLRNTITIKEQSQTRKDYQAAAAKLWRIFKLSSNSTKKILHYLLGDKNQHKITNDGLRQYGFHKIINQYDQKTIRLAKIYLREQTLRQINEGKVNQYIQQKRLKDKQKFQRYVQFFVEELQEGFLRKRLPKEKVFQLQRS